MAEAMEEANDEVKEQKKKEKKDKKKRKAENGDEAAGMWCFLELSPGPPILKKWN